MDGDVSPRTRTPPLTSVTRCRTLVTVGTSFHVLRTTPVPFLFHLVKAERRSVSFPRGHVDEGKTPRAVRGWRSDVPRPSGAPRGGGAEGRVAPARERPVGEGPPSFGRDGRGREETSWGDPTYGSPSNRLGFREGGDPNRRARLMPFHFLLKKGSFPR